jgi:tetratricopeptide (TPR) repeat protein
MVQSPGVATLLSEAYKLLVSLDLVSAQTSLEKALAIDFDDPELLFSMKCARWWADSMEKALAIADSFEAGEYAIARWKAFRNFIAKLEPIPDRALAAFKHFAYGWALARYRSITSEDDTIEPELALRLGRTSKGKGDFETAVKFLEGAAKNKKDDPSILAELADAYGLIDEQRVSKALFREAFFINPQKVDIDLLESSAIVKLLDKVIEAGKLGIETSEWIPVLGELLGVFSIKRELKPIEAGKLKQSIYELETELGADSSRRPILVPRLINRYFWLVDHYMNRKEDKSKIDELLLKIKLLDATVYKQYIA